MFSRYVLAVIFITTQYGHEFRCDSLLYDSDHGYMHTHTHIYIYICVCVHNHTLLEKTHQMWDPEAKCMCILAGAFSQLARGTLAKVLPKLYVHFF